MILKQQKEEPLQLEISKYFMKDFLKEGGVVRMEQAGGAPASVCAEG